jgi:hypothetical protein
MRYRIARLIDETSFLEEVVDAFSKIASAHDDELNKLAGQIDRSLIPHEDEYWCELQYRSHTTDEVQQILARSLIMTVGMTIESELNKLSTYLQRRHKEKIPPRDYKNGRGMKTRVDYINVLSGKELLKQDSDFDLLVELRNIIAHDNGWVSAKKIESLKLRYGSSNLLPEFRNGRIFIHQQLLPKFVEVAKRIMTATHNYWECEKNLVFAEPMPEN